MKDLFTKFINFFKSLRKYPEASLLHGATQRFEFGVCAGIAYRLKIHVVIVRLAFLFSMLSTWTFLVGLLIYVLPWMFAPAAETPEDYKQTCGKKILPYDFYWIRDTTILCGVFSGLAYKFKLHPLILLLMRLGAVAFYIFLSHIILYAYFSAWILFPPRDKPEDYDQFCKLTKESIKRLFK